MTTISYDWIKQIPPDLLPKDTSPIIGYPPPFPWDEFSKRMAQLLELEDLKIQPISMLEQRSEKDLSAGLGRTVSLQLSIAPAAGSLWWIMNEEDITLLMSLLLTHQAQSSLKLDTEFQQGFYNFLALEVINILPQIAFEKSLSIHLLHEAVLPNNPALCLDVSITVQQRTVWGRLILSPELQESWKERYATRTLAPIINQNLNVIVQLEAGRTSLKFSEWNKVALGDFIALDSYALEPDGHGHVLLTVGQVPFFSGEIQNGSVTILEPSLYHEVEKTMDTQLPNEEEPLEQPEEELTSTDNVDDEDIHEEDLPEDENENVDEGIIENEGEEDIETMEGPQEQEKWPPPPEMPRRPLKTAERMTSETAPEQEIMQPVKEKVPLTSDDIPLSIVIEVGRVQMTMQKLLELEPGAVLQLSVRPEDGVDLVVNGRRIAKGELLRLGDVLGVRILDIG